MENSYLFVMENTHNIQQKRKLRFASIYKKKKVKKIKVFMIKAPPPKNS